MLAYLNEKDLSSRRDSCHFIHLLSQHTSSSSPSVTSGRIWASQWGLQLPGPAYAAVNGLLLQNPDAWMMVWTSGPHKHLKSPFPAPASPRTLGKRLWNSLLLLHLSWQWCWQFPNKCRGKILSNNKAASRWCQTVVPGTPGETRQSHEPETEVWKQRKEKRRLEDKGRNKDH